jgi:hypothetical protein
MLVLLFSLLMELKPKILILIVKRASYVVLKKTTCCLFFPPLAQVVIAETARTIEGDSTPSGAATASPDPSRVFTQVTIATTP